jgi:hypothetical protein
VRAVVLALSACIAASLSAYRVLQGALRNRLGVLAFGAAGPLVALGLMRILERAGAGPAMFVVVPLGSAACTPLAAWLASQLQRLPIRIRAASTHSRV